MAIIGAQQQTGASDDNFALRLQSFVEGVEEGIRPQHWEWAANTDSAGAYNKVMIAYWESKASYLRWGSESGFEN
jgi:hypothetical protein